MTSAILSRPRRSKLRRLRPPITNGLVRHFDARTLIGQVADGGTVSSWEDLSTYGADVSTNGAHNPPFFKRNAWDGKPGLLFNGENRGLENTSTSGRPTKDLTVFAVASAGYKGSFPVCTMWGPGTTTNGWRLYWYSGASPVYRPSMISRRSGAAWGDHWALQAGATRPQRRDPTILCGFNSGGTTGIRWDKGNETTDAGTDANIDYGAGGPFAIGVQDTTAAQDTIIHAVLVYDRKLSAAEITVVEDWLDRQWRVTYEHRNYECLFNGGTGGGDYKIGHAWSPDGHHWKRYPSNPVISAGSGWESSHVKDPWVVWDPDAGEWVCYYAGYNGTQYQIGRATASDLRGTWTKYGSNPVIALGSGGAFDDEDCFFPCVVYDPDDADPDYLWKMLYGAHDGTTTTIGYASSPDGLTWTKRGKVLDVGAASAWDESGVNVGCFRKNAGGTWELWFQGLNSAGIWQGGFATASDPGGTWTKDAGNPAAPARSNASGKSTTSTGGMGTSDSNIGTTGNTLELWEPTSISDSNSEPDSFRCVEPSATAPRFSNAPDTAMASGSAIRSVFYRSVITRSILDLGDVIVAYGTAFQVTNDITTGGTNFKEMSHRATADAASPEGPYSFDLDVGILFGIDAAGTGLWDDRSAENPCVVARRPPT